MSKQKVIIQWEEDGEIKKRISQGELTSLPEINGPGVIARMLIEGYDKPVTVEKLGREKTWVYSA